MKRAFWKRFGPGMLVTAAFIGPGTVTTASRAGADYGVALAWALGIAVISAMVLQEMAARLGLVTRQGLGEALSQAFGSKLARGMAVVFVLSAILIGNVAYQAGNLVGAATGLESLLGGSVKVWVLVSGCMAVGLLVFGAYPLVQRVLIGLVLLMSAVFVGSAVISAPALATAGKDVFRLELPSGTSLGAVIALIGTTVVPYNLFLHARSVQEKWSACEGEDLGGALTEARWDTVIAILLGGIITFAILLTSASAFYVQGVAFENLGQGASQLEPLLGRAAKVAFALGLFAAGLTSTITAPLAAAYATSGCLGWTQGWRDRRFQGVAIGVVLIGMLVALTLGRSPQALILFAQTANGLLLPVVAIFLLVVMNRSRLLGEHRNGLCANVLGGLVVLTISLLAGWKLWQAWS